VSLRAFEPTSRLQLLALSEYIRRTAEGLPGAELHGLGLAPYELRVSSQNGEDGVIGEILRRAGIKSPGFFVEFGGEDGVELNSALLADALGWHGAFIEGDGTKHHFLHRKYNPHGRVAVGHAMVLPDTVEELFDRLGVPAEFDLLSIDIDGDDYWVWNAIQRFSPKVVVIEINTHLDPRVARVQPEGAGPWQGTDFYGSSLEAVRLLGIAKGYRLVHVDLTGNNAFFVRNDVPGDYPEQIETLGPNHYLIGWAHPPDESGRQYIAPPGAPELPNTP
jgi:hypothetical protein